MTEPEFNLQASTREFEGKMTHYYNVALRADKIQNASDSQLRLMCGELTAQEIRSIRAIVNYIKGN
jgi:hypothetical protein